MSTSPLANRSLLSSSLSSSIIRLTPRCTLFPYTTLFRSLVAADLRDAHHEQRAHEDQEVRCEQEEDDDDLHPERLGLGERSEEHTSELQSLRHLVCRLLLEKKNYTSGTSPLLPI